ncbi:MAG: tetratricopeptide repeat protein [Candidatus Omnitrophota bacterium]
MKNFRIPAALVALIIIVSAAFLPSLGNGFVNWDDQLYVTENSAVADFSFSGAERIFSSFFAGNYQPLTIFSYSLDRLFSGLNPYGYHLTNLILHLLNCLLVFWLFYLLSRLETVGLLTAVFFGLHPLRVESVAWISQRKDLLYAFFFLAALIFYLYYLRKDKKERLYYYLALGSFLCSLLSKAMAVVLPLVLMATDYFIGRPKGESRIRDKIPFFALSVIFGAVALMGQYSDGAVRPDMPGGAWGMLSVPFYAVFFYLQKIFFPAGLSCLYPRNDIHLSFGFFLLPAAYVVICILLFLLNKGRKKIVFSNLFFLICLLPVLQFVPLGETMVADRYTYLASAGISYLCAAGLVFLWGAGKRYPGAARVVIIATLVFLSGSMVFMSRQRCRAWHDSLTLWSDVLEKYPNAAMAYHNRAIAYNENKEYPEAILDFNRAASLLPEEQRRMIYLYLIRLYREEGREKEAEDLFEKIKKSDAGVFRRYYQNANRLRDAGRYRKAIALYQGARELNPENPALDNDEGVAYLYYGKFKKAAVLFEKALRLGLDPGLAHNNLALAYYYGKNYAAAIEHCKLAIDLGYPVNSHLLSLLRGRPLKGHPNDL